MRCRVRIVSAISTPRRPSSRLTDDRPHNFVPGPVALFGQSGGIVMAIKRTLEERGVIVGCADHERQRNRSHERRLHYLFRPGSGHARDRLLSRDRSTIRRLFSPPAGARAMPANRSSSSSSALPRPGAPPLRPIPARSPAPWKPSTPWPARLARYGCELSMISWKPSNISSMPRRRAGDRLASITFSGGMRGLMLDAAEANGLPYRSLSEATSAKLSDVLGRRHDHRQSARRRICGADQRRRLCPLHRDAARGSGLRYSPAAGRTAAGAKSPQGREFANRQRHGRSRRQSRSLSSA